MRITINGQMQEFPAALTVEALVAQLQIDPRQVAVERNRAIVSRSCYGETVLADGDVIEIVRFIGGG